MSKEKIEVTYDLSNGNDWMSHTFYDRGVLINRTHYSNEVFKCVEKVYYGGQLQHHYSYVHNTNIFEGEIISYGQM